VVSLLPIRGLPLVRPGDDLSALLLAAIADGGQTLQRGDVLVLAQKIVSKAEGRVVSVETICPSQPATELAERAEKDPRLVELILRESREVIRVRPGLIIVEDRRGFVCANAGIDRSNVEQGAGDETVTLLPLDPDTSARIIRERIIASTGLEVALIINDSHGRAWRQGTVGVAIGLAGLPPVWDRRGDPDLTGYILQHTVIGIADEIASAASLLMGPAAEGVPAVIVRGLTLPPGDGTARDIQRPREMDLFR
jgi:coenzyme F420-0:L-glutamate ligase/coenzyme F420-1:gamma-L-glutamate ligase